MSGTQVGGGADSNSPSIKLYLLHHSQALRILWLLKILELPYSLISIPRRRDRHYPDLLAASPLGKSPILEIDGVVITESRLCAAALTSIRPLHTLQSRSTDDVVRDTYFQELAGSSFTPAVHMCLMFDIIHRSSPWLVRPLIGLVTGAILKPLKRELVPYMDLLEAHLAHHEFLGGQTLGVSDVLMSWPIDLSVSKQFVDLSNWQNVKQWHGRIQDMESYKSAVRESGGYDLVNLGA